jgi:hypothetical protein
MDLTPNTELTLQQGADLAKVSDKTLRRRIKDGTLASSEVAGRHVITVAALVAAGLYTMGAESASDLRRADRLECELGQMRAKCIALDSELRLVRAELAAERQTRQEYFKLLITRDKSLVAAFKDVA